MDSKAVIQKVNGLNSPTTLKRWRRMAENLTGTEFKRNKENIFCFTQEDITKFQKVADAKEQKGLEAAIIFAFSKDGESPLSLNERIDLLETLVIELRQQVDAQNMYNRSIDARFNNGLVELGKRIDLIMGQPKIKKLLAKQY